MGKLLDKWKGLKKSLGSKEIKEGAGDLKSIGNDVFRMMQRFDSAASSALIDKKREVKKDGNSVEEIQKHEDWSSGEQAQ
jgi:ABC-type transporter Mla MlaB component